MTIAAGRLAAAVVVGLALAPPIAVRAGGGSFDTPDDDKDANAGGSLFGFVKDKDGDPIDDAKVTVSFKSYNASLVVRTDPQGHFFIKTLYRNIDPADLDLACSKDGYKEVAHTRRPSLAAGAPIEIDCVLERH